MTRAILMTLLVVMAFGLAAIGQGRCGDGVCDEVERTSGLCAEDCGTRVVITHVLCAEVGRVAAKFAVQRCPSTLRCSSVTPLAKSAGVFCGSRTSARM